MPITGSPVAVVSRTLQCGRRADVDSAFTCGPNPRRTEGRMLRAPGGRGRGREAGKKNKKHRDQAKGGAPGVPGVPGVPGSAIVGGAPN